MCLHLSHITSCYYGPTAVCVKDSVVNTMIYYKYSLVNNNPPSNLWTKVAFWKRPFYSRLKKYSSLSNNGPTTRFIIAFKSNVTDHIILLAKWMWWFGAFHFYCNSLKDCNTIVIIPSKKFYALYSNFNFRYELQNTFLKIAIF